MKKAIVLVMVWCLAISVSMGQNYELELGEVVKNSQNVSKIVHADAENILAVQHPSWKKFSLVSFKNLRIENQSTEFTASSFSLKKSKPTIVTRTEYLYGQLYLNRNTYDKRTNKSVNSLIQIDNKTLKQSSEQTISLQEDEKNGASFGVSYYSSESGKTSIQLWSSPITRANTKITYYVSMMNSDMKVEWTYKINADFVLSKTSAKANVIVSDLGFVVMHFSVKSKEGIYEKHIAIMNEKEMVLNEKLDLPSDMYIGETWLELNQEEDELVVMSLLSEEEESSIDMILVQAYSISSGNVAFESEVVVDWASMELSTPSTIKYNSLKPRKDRKLGKKRISIRDLSIDGEGNILIFGEEVWEWTFTRDMKEIVGGFYAGDTYVVKLDKLGDYLWGTRIYKDMEVYMAAPGFKQKTTEDGFSYLFYELDKRHLDQSSQNENNESRSKSEKYGCLAMSIVSPEGDVSTEILLDHQKNKAVYSLSSIDPYEIGDEQLVLLVVEKELSVEDESYRFLRLHLKK